MDQEQEDAPEGAYSLPCTPVEGTFVPDGQETTVGLIGETDITVAVPAGPLGDDDCPDLLKNKIFMEAVHLNYQFFHQNESCSSKSGLVKIII